ncbi:hypothetical protein GCK32_019607, partial [Trichostrongylus colubriformis]
DQDHGKRVWLHEVLDRRFPTRDKLHHVAKWKSCTTAINRNKADSFPGPLTSTESRPLAAPPPSTKTSSSEKKDSTKDKENRKKEEETSANSKRNQVNATNRRTIEKETVLDTKEKEAQKETKEDSAKKERGSSRISARARGSRHISLLVFLPVSNFLLSSVYTISLF